VGLQIELGFLPEGTDFVVAAINVNLQAKDWYFLVHLILLNIRLSIGVRKVEKVKL
jgi:hypothetical protein